MALTLLIVGAVVAVGDWVAVHLRLYRLEYGLKPLALLLLLLAAVFADLGGAQPWIVVGLAFSLLGDIALLRSSEDNVDLAFVGGLAAFFIAHVSYVIGFVRTGARFVDVLAGLLVVLGVAGLSVPAVLRGAQRVGGPRFVALLAAYAAVLSLMTVFAAGTGIALTAIGGLLFLASDTLLGRQRFVRRIEHGPVLVIATYHLAQFFIVLGLAQAV